MKFIKKLYTKTFCPGPDATHAERCHVHGANAQLVIWAIGYTIMGLLSWLVF